MTYFLSLLLLGTFPAQGQPAGIAPIGVFTRFQNPPSAAVVRAIQQEVARITAPLGIPFEWKSLDRVTPNDIVTELAVIQFCGLCQTTELIPGPLTGPLGITHVSDGEVLPFADIDCHAIRALLRKQLLQTSGDRRDAVLGRAIGRVLAHELFHIFAKSAHHGSGGVGKPAFTERELVSDEFEFETSEVRMLRASLVQARRQNSRLRRVASALSGRFLFREHGCPRCHGVDGRGTRNAPALRATGKTVETKALAAHLSKNLAAMYAASKRTRLPIPTLDDDEIADVARFLSDLY